MGTVISELKPISGRFRAVVVGASAGGIDALGKIVAVLPRDFPLPIVAVLHLPDSQPSLLAEVFSGKTSLKVKDAEEKEMLNPGTIYFAVPGYHLLMERDFTFSLSTESPVQYSRPSIDVLFESAADALGKNLLGILLTGANRDGARGLKRIQDSGGLALIQDPNSAEVRSMPDAACELIAAKPSQLLSLENIASLLAGLAPIELSESQKQEIVT